MFKRQFENKYPYPTDMNNKNEESRNKEFERILKKNPITGVCPPDKIYRLRKAYESKAIPSLYYWLENSPVDFNTGSDIAILLLNRKYDILDSSGNHLHTSDLSNFIYMELPDLSENELKDIGFTDKKDLVTAILTSHSQLKKEAYEAYGYKAVRLGLSPFLTYEYWLACYRHNPDLCMASCEGVDDIECLLGEIEFSERKENGELKNLYEKWFNSIAKKYIKRANCLDLDIGRIYEYFYEGDLCVKNQLEEVKRNLKELNRNHRVIEVYYENKKLGYDIAYRIIDLKIIYSGENGTKVAYRIENNKIYTGETGTKVVYRIDEDTVYSGETGYKIAFRIEEKKIFTGASRDKVAYTIEREILPSEKLKLSIK